MARKDPIAHLGRHTDRLPPRLVDEIVALGPSAHPRLLALLEDRAAWIEGAPGHVALRNALTVIGESPELFGREPILEMLVASEREAPTHLAAAYALTQHLGPELVEPLLALAVEGKVRDEVTTWLAWCGVHDARIAERLVELVRRVPGEGAVPVAAYGDKSLAPALFVVFDGLLGEANDPDALLEAEEVLSAAQRLVGPDLERMTALRNRVMVVVHELREGNERLERSLGRR